MSAATPNLKALYHALNDSTDKTLYVVTHQTRNAYHSRYFVVNANGLADVTLWVARHLGQRMNREESHVIGTHDFSGMASQLTRVLGFTVTVKQSS